VVTSPPRWRRIAQPIGLLLLYVAVIRGLPERLRAAAPDDGCASDPSASPSEPGPLERCLELHNDDVELMTDLGAAYERVRQYDRAETVYRRALEIEPDNGDVHVRLGALLLQRGDVDAADREGAAALKMQPGRAAAMALVRRVHPPPTGSTR
jgi:tetratricopeptide (TPR) repeat protein